MKKILKPVFLALVKLYSYWLIFCITGYRKVFGRKTFEKKVEGIDGVFLPFLLRSLGADIGDDVKIESGLRLHNSQNLKQLKINDGAYIGKNFFLDLKDKVVIGKNVTIAMNCSLLTHQDVGCSSLIHLYPRESKSVVIKENVYIGEGVTLLMGVVIGANTVIGSKALVSKSCDNNSIYAGVPAKKIKRLQ